MWVPEFFFGILVFGTEHGHSLPAAMIGTPTWFDSDWRSPLSVHADGGDTAAAIRSCMILTASGVDNVTVASLLVGEARRRGASDRSGRRPRKCPAVFTT